MPLSYWYFVVTTSVYLINLLPTPTLNNESLFLKLFGTIPNYNKLRCFGCLYYPWLWPYTSHKLELRSMTCLFVGYSSTQTAYLYLDTFNNGLYTSRHVRFVESVFPFANSPQNLSRVTPSTISEWCSMTLPVTFSVSSSHQSISSPQPSSSPPATSPTQPSLSPLAHTPTSDQAITQSTIPTTVPPTYHKGIITRSKNNICKPIQKLNLNIELYHPTLEPTTVTQALKDSKWRQAMFEEFDTLFHNGT